MGTASESDPISERSIQNLFQGALESHAAYLIYNKNPENWRGALAFMIIMKKITVFL